MTTLAATFLAALGAFGFALLGLGIGRLMGRAGPRGSCGGACDLCPRREERRDP